MPTNASSAFRLLGNAPFDAFRAAVSRTYNGKGTSPLAAEVDAVYEALSARGMVRLGAAMAWHERKNDSWPRDYGLDSSFRNPWAMKDGRGGWKRYASYAEAAADWTRRLLDPAGPYADAATLRDFLMIYAPPSDGNNVDLYVATVAKEVDALEPLIVPTDPTPPPLDPWRPYPYPNMVDLIVAKPAHDQAGFDRLTYNRRPHIRGFCTHITDGPQSQTIEFFASFFGTGGARAWDALTDLVIGADGRIGLLNDWRFPDRGGTRAGWANGSTDGLEGDGIPFYRQFPLINVVLVSCEHATKAGQAWTDATIASSIEIRTAIAQELKCPAASYPYHPSYSNVRVEQEHRNFATKSGPAEPYIARPVRGIMNGVQRRLFASRGGAAERAAPPPPPPVVEEYGPLKFDRAMVNRLWGVLQRHNANGTIDALPFDPKGPLSLLWLDRCSREGRWPESEELWVSDSAVASGKEWYASWEGGWLAYLPLDNARAGWSWVDESAKGLLPT